ncbi:hypothetical protein BN77_p10580 [Rhizobium mesoamericanum STM3625]|uniref:Uncharacterized protein n=1 Tax=Rhizobium mesoamericanum STM3625 TaxID=1211777 RepID=K0PRK4_9HYPH|nr:hypothetical protein BN77_p10580 [Rhizobium mesoamericanum STM3625]
MVEGAQPFGDPGAASKARVPPPRALPAQVSPLSAGASQKDERECLGECEDILLKSYPAGMKPRNIDGQYCVS